MVDAHVQKFTHSYLVHYPAHPPRAHDPHKKDFEAWKQKRRDTGTYYCDFAHDHRNGDESECDVKHPLEAHHKVVELAMLNEVDFTLLEADYPGVSDPDSAGAWIDSDENLTLLCLTPGSPILMDDGTERLIQDILPGDSVITKDGTPQIVQGVSRNKYRGDVFTLGRSGFTPTHRLLAHGGWLPVSEIQREIGMHGPDVVRVRCIEHQVRREIVSPVAVNVMNSFSGLERSADQPFHDMPMFHNHLASRKGYPDISFRGKLAGSFLYRDDLPGKSVKTSYPAGVGTVMNGTHPDRENLIGKPAFGTDEPGIFLRISPVHATTSAALPGTAGIAVRKRFGDKEVLLADGALLDRKRHVRAYGWWDTPGEIRKISYSGWVHDLIVPHNTSYVSSGVVVHNCTFHHRGPMGVHCASYSDFGSEAYVRDLITGAL